MRIDIWSDVVCPWCFIGKRRLERALSELIARGTFTEEDNEVVFHAYQLDPGAPLEPTETVAEMLGRKYGGGTAGAQKMIDQVDAVAAEEGLLFRQSEAKHANTGDAHRLLHLALAEGGPAQQRALKEALLSAYFLRAENVADHDVLVAAATEVGLDEARAREVLTGREYADEVQDDIATAGRLGATGVPFFVIDEKYGVAGAQPVEVFTQVLERAWAESRPLQMVTGVSGAAGADACGPDGCAI